MIDVTVGLALENAIKDALEAKCEVFLTCPNEQTLEQLEKLGVIDLISESHMYSQRFEALEAGLKFVESSEVQSAVVVG
jgi:SulP family sulfate permease